MTTVTGREPRLSATYTLKGKRLLPLKRLANLLEVLPPASVPLAVAAEALRSDAFYVRYAAARILNQRGDRAARLVMQQALNEGNAPTRASVARQLYGFSWFAIEPMIQQALRDTDVRVRENGMYALADAHELSAYQLMARVLRDEADSVRAAAAWGLRNCQDPVTIPVFDAVLLANDPEVRIQALEILGTNGLSQALPLIRAHLHDPDMDVQYAAALSLLEVAGESCLAELAQLIQQHSGQTRQAVLRGLFHATNYLKINLVTHAASGALVNALEAALTDPLPTVREAALWPLAWLPIPRAADLLRTAYERESDPVVQAQFVKITASLGSPAASAIVHAARQSEHENVQEAAQQALSVHAL
jgi:HEAT repeat protein